MKICVIGSGFVGLAVGCVLADCSHEVACTDVDHQRVTGLQGGTAALSEPDFDDLIQRNVATGHLLFTTDSREAAAGADIIFIAVGTPATLSGEADLSQLWTAIDQLLPTINHDCLLVIKSTVPVGTASAVRKRLDQSPSASKLISLISNPEFLRVGAAVTDFKHPQRVVLGSTSEAALQKMEALYRSFVEPSIPIYKMGHESAELSKYAANSMLALRISFINEIAELSESLGANIHDVVSVLSSDNRIGPHHLKPGPGFGGSCLLKDVQSLVSQAGEHGRQFGIGEETLKVNERQSDNVITKLSDALGTLSGKRICLFGLTFKAGTDDTRESPSIRIADKLLATGATVTAYDPAYRGEAGIRIGSVIYADDPYTGCENVDAIVITTDWPEFAELDYAEIAQRVTNKLIIDTRNILDPTRITEHGFHYVGKGLPHIT